MKQLNIPTPSVNHDLEESFSVPTPCVVGENCEPNPRAPTGKSANITRAGVSEKEGLFLSTAHSIKENGILTFRRIAYMSLSNDGECTPSYDHIAKHCQTSTSTVKRSVRRIKNLGLIMVDNRAPLRVYEDGEPKVKWRPNRYTLTEFGCWFWGAICMDPSRAQPGKTAKQEELENPCAAGKDCESKGPQQAQDLLIVGQGWSTNLKKEEKKKENFSFTEEDWETEEDFDPVRSRERLRIREGRHCQVPSEGGEGHGRQEEGRHIVVGDSGKGHWGGQDKSGAGKGPKNPAGDVQEDRGNEDDQPRARSGKTAKPTPRTVGEDREDSQVDKVALKRAKLAGEAMDEAEIMAKENLKKYGLLPTKVHNLLKRGTSPSILLQALRRIYNWPGWNWSSALEKTLAEMNSDLEQEKRRVAADREREKLWRAKCEREEKERAAGPPKVDLLSMVMAAKSERRRCSHTPQVKKIHPRADGESR